MALPVSLFLDGLNTLPRRCVRQPVVSVVVTAGRWATIGFETTLAALSRQQRADMEVLLVDDGLSGRHRALVDAFHGQDDRVTVLRFARCGGIPAIGVNAALLRASGRYIAYQTGNAHYLDDALAGLLDGAERNPGAALVAGACRLPSTEALSPDAMLDGSLHRRELLERAGLADPHLLMCDGWADDLMQRLSAEAPPERLPHAVVELHRMPRPAPTGGLGGRARSRPRADRLRPDAIEGLDVLESSFLRSRDAVDRFHEEIAAPYVARHWQQGERLHPRAVPYLALWHPLRLHVVGWVNMPSMKICYDNFARAFPDRLEIIHSSKKTGFDLLHERNALVYFRYAHSPVPAEDHQRLRDAGRPILFSMDDNLLRLRELPYYTGDRWNEQHSHLLGYLRDADQIVTWSPICAADVRPLNPRIGVLRTNLLSERLPSRVSPPAGDGRLRYTTLSSNIHVREDIWRTVAEELRCFFKTYEREARLVLFDRDGTADDLYKSWFDGVDAEIRPWSPYDAYMDRSKESHFHVVMALLADDIDFLRSKCPIKILEATACGAIAVVSDAQVYREFEDGVSCIKVDSRPGAWTRALEASLELGHEGRNRIWQAARRQIERDFVTEAQFFQFFLVHEAARLHLRLGSRDREGGKAAILVVEPEASAAAKAVCAWSRLLERQNLTVVHESGESCGVDDAARRLAAVVDAGHPVALVLAPDPRSPWIAAARRADLPSVATADLADVPPADSRPTPFARPDLVIARTGTVARRARAAGWSNVHRLAVPLAEGVWRGPAAKGWDSADPRPRLGLVCGPDVDAGLIGDRLRKALIACSLPADLEAPPGVRDILVAAGNGGEVVDAALAAMAAGTLVIAAYSRDVEELLQNGINGWSLAKAGTTLAGLLAEILALSSDQQASIRQNSRATAWAMTAEDAVLLNLTVLLQVPGVRGSVPAA